MKSGSTRAGEVTSGRCPIRSIIKANTRRTCSALKKGFVTLTPLDFDLTKRSVLAEMESWQFDLKQDAVNTLRQTTRSVVAMNTCAWSATVGGDGH